MSRPSRVFGYLADRWGVNGAGPIENKAKVSSVALRNFFWTLLVEPGRGPGAAPAWSTLTGSPLYSLLYRRMVLLLFMIGPLYLSTSPSSSLSPLPSPSFIPFCLYGLTRYGRQSSIGGA